MAGTFRIPVIDERVDVLLTHFSPVSAAEFRRVVKPGGVVLVGGPAEDHLFAFKKLLYDSRLSTSPLTPWPRRTDSSLITVHRIRYPLRLRGPGQVANLLLMPPFSWSVGDEARSKLAEMDELDTEVDVVVHAYRRVPTTHAPEASAGEMAAGSIEQR